MTKKILVTGAAGFIGSHVVQTLIERGVRVVGTFYQAAGVYVHGWGGSGAA